MAINLRDKKGKILKGNNLIHGLSKDPIYDCWIAMKARVTNPQHPEYKHYGGRGIKVCQRWKKNFNNFLQDMGPKPNFKSTIERVDNGGDYEPSNCRWVSIQEQQKNKRNSNTVPGVHFEKSRNQWHVDIVRGKRKIFLGRYKDFDEAREARLRAEKLYV